MDINLKREKQREYQQKWRLKNPSYMTRFRAINKEALKEYNTNWSKTNKDKRTNSSARYRSKKLQAIPNWLTHKDYVEIENLYLLAKHRTEITGIQWHVDHIIPLQGKTVCGLHVPTNLQVIAATDNYSKKNKFIILHE